jgi:hypothetical protein
VGSKEFRILAKFEEGTYYLPNSLQANNRLL